MTSEQITKLHQAIDLAESPGLCKYVRNGAPCCVIAQLHILNGGSVNDMANWHQMTVVDHPSFHFLDYPLDLLDSIQLIWDAPNGPSADKRRKAMHEKVNECSK